MEKKQIKVKFETYEDVAKMNAKQARAYIKKELKYTGNVKIWFAWIPVIEDLIKKHTTPIKHGKFKGYGSTKVFAWLADLMKFVNECKPKFGVVEGNLFFSRILGLALTTWYFKTSRAKAYDPRRQIIHRQFGLQLLRDDYRTLFEAIIYDAYDHVLYPAQDFEIPFGDKATNGDIKY